MAFCQSPEETRNRYRGSLLGLAVGDALGTTLEFLSPGTFKPIDDMVGGGPFRLKPGQWTDDTSMALCLAESLLECQGFDPVDQMERYVRWWREGYWSSTGACFDIGNTIAAALSSFLDTGEAFAGSTDPRSAGNGSIMRLAPIPLYFAGDPAKAIEMAAQSSHTTHGTREAVDACRYLAALILGAVRGDSKEKLLGEHFEPVLGIWREHRLAEKIAEIAEGSYKHKDPPEICGTGYVVKSLEAALWAFQRSSSFREGALMAVNLGDDADTTGAVYGQLAGAFYGEAGIPKQWRNRVTYSREIQTLADRLFPASATGEAQRE